MDALVSGSARVAVLIDDGELHSVHLTANGVRRSRRKQHEIPYLLGDAQDLNRLEGVDEATVLGELDLAQSGVDALHLSLLLCDPRTSERAIALAVQELEALLARPAVTERVERILYAKPIPAPFDLSLARARCQACLNILKFVSELEELQPAISEVRAAWEALPRSWFNSPNERNVADGLLAREGHFRALVLASAKKANLADWLPDALRPPAGGRGQAWQRWLLAWVQHLRWPTALPGVAASYGHLGHFKPGARSRIEWHSVDLPGTTAEHDVDFLLRAMRVYWPEGVVEGGDDMGVCALGKALRRSWSTPCQLSIYPDWQNYERQASPVLRDGGTTLFVLILFEGERLAVTAGGQKSELHELVKNVGESLKRAPHRRHRLDLEQTHLERAL